jgi:hypothetical protein
MVSYQLILAVCFLLPAFIGNWVTRTMAKAMRAPCFSYGLVPTARFDYLYMQTFKNILMGYVRVCVCVCVCVVVRRVAPAFGRT